MDTSTISTRLIPTVQYVTPTTGSTVSAADSGNVTILINPAGALVSLTLALNPSPQNGDALCIASSKVITTFTMTGGTVIGAMTSMTLGGSSKYIYSSDAGVWARIQAIV